LKEEVAEAWERVKSLPASMGPRDDTRAVVDVLVRGDTRYVLGPFVVLESDRVVVLTFPATFPDEGLAGVSVAGVVFAERPGQFWAEFTHPLDGHRRSVLAEPSWIS